MEVEEKEINGLKFFGIALLVFLSFSVIAGYLSDESNKNQMQNIQTSLSNIISGDYTVYPVTCIDWFTNDTLTPPAEQDFSNCHNPKAMERETFHVDVAKNEIVLTSPDTSDVIKLDYCTIQDKQHWSCGSGNFSKMPGAIYAATKISRSGDNFNEYGLSGMIFVTESQWNSINNGKTSICGLKYCP